MRLTLNTIREHYRALVAAAVIILVAVFFPSHHSHQPSIDRGDVAAFTRDCVSPVLGGGPVKPSCQSLVSIQKKYHVDAQAELIMAQGARIMTARRIARGDITTEKQYRVCLNQGDCAAIPIIPDHLDSHNAQADENRREFWHLVNSGSITPQDCAALPLCRAMVKLHLIPAPQEAVESASLQTP